MRCAFLLMRRRNDLRPISTNRKPPATMPQRRVLKTEVTSLEVFSCLGLGRLADSAACDDGALRAALRVLAALGRREDRPLLARLQADLGSGQNLSHPSRFVRFIKIREHLSISLTCLNTWTPLQDDHLVAKIGFDTAENEPSEIW